MCATDLPERPFTMAAARDDGDRPGRSLLWLAVMVPVLIAIALRVGYSFEKPEQLQGDGAVYDRMSRQLLDHGYLGYSPERLRSWRPPLYPAFIASTYAAFGPTLLAAKLVQSVLGGAVTALVVLLGRRVHSTWAGFAAGMIYATLSNEIRHATRLYPETLACLFLTAFALVALERPTLWRAALLGALSGGLVHLQPAFVTLPVLWIGAVLIRLGGEQRWRLAGVTMLVLALTCVPWAIRNWGIHERVVFISTNGGFNLLKGNNEGARPFVSDDAANLARYEASIPDGLDEVARDRWYRARAAEWIRDHPQDYARLCLGRLREWVLPQFLVEPGSWWPVTYGTIAPFALVGLAGMFRRRKPVLHLLVPLAATGLPAVLIVYAGERYRSPSISIVAVLAGSGLVLLGRWVYRLRARRCRAAPHEAQ